MKFTALFCNRRISSKQLFGKSQFSSSIFSGRYINKLSQKFSQRYSKAAFLEKPVLLKNLLILGYLEETLLETSQGKRLF